MERLPKSIFNFKTSDPDSLTNHHLMVTFGTLKFKSVTGAFSWIGTPLTWYFLKPYHWGLSTSYLLFSFIIFYVFQLCIRYNLQVVDWTWDYDIAITVVSVLLCNVKHIDSITLTVISAVSVTLQLNKI